jgi:hypothetical protein
VGVLPPGPNTLTIEHGRGPKVMSSRPGMDSRRAPRAWSRVALLVLLVHLAQPALAGLLSACEEHACGSVTTAGCCCEEALAPEPETAEDGCCAEPDPDPRPAPEACSCRADPPPAPDPLPALPLGGSELAGERAPEALVRLYARISWQSLGAPLGAPPESREDQGARGRPGSAGAPGGPPGPRASSAGAWTLISRGIGGLLALLSVARS